MNEGFGSNLSDAFEQARAKAEAEAQAKRAPEALPSEVLQKPIDLTDIKDVTGQAETAHEGPAVHAEAFKNFLAAFSIQLDNAKNAADFIEHLSAAHQSLFGDGSDKITADRVNSFIEHLSTDLNGLIDGPVKSGASKDQIFSAIDKVAVEVGKAFPGSEMLYTQALKKFVEIEMINAKNTTQESVPAAKESTPAASAEATRNQEYIEGEKVKLINLQKGLLYNLARLSPQNSSITTGNLLRNIITSLETQKDVMAGLNGTDAVTAQDIRAVEDALRATEGFKSEIDASQIDFNDKDAVQVSIVTYTDLLLPLIQKHEDYYTEQRNKYHGPNANAGQTQSGNKRESARVTKGFDALFLEHVMNSSDKQQFIDSLVAEWKRVYGGKPNENSERVSVLVKAVFNDIKELNELAKTASPELLNAEIDHRVLMATSDLPTVSNAYHEALKKFITPGQPEGVNAPKTAEAAEPEPQPAPKPAPAPTSAPEVAAPAPAPQPEAAPAEPAPRPSKPPVVPAEAAPAAPAEPAMNPSSEIPFAPAAEIPPFVYRAPAIELSAINEAITISRNGDIHDRIAHVLDTYPDFIKEWSKDPQRASVLEAATPGEEGTERFFKTFEAYLTIPRIVSESEALIKSDVLKADIFKNIQIKDDIAAALAANLESNPEMILTIDELIRDFRTCEKNIPALESKIESFGNVDELKKETAKLEEEIKKYEAAEQAGFFTPLKAHTKAVVYGVRDVWNKAWGKTDYHQEVQTYESLTKIASKIAKDDPQFYDGLIRETQAAVLAREEVRAFDQIIKSPTTPPENKLAAELGRSKYVSEQSKIEMLRIYNDIARREKELSDKRLTARQKEERADYVRMKARDAVIAEGKLDERVKVNFFNPREVLGIFGTERRPFGNPFRPEMRKRLEELKSELAKKSTVVRSAEATADLKAQTDSISKRVKTAAIQSLGIEKVIRDKAREQIVTALDKNYLGNLNKLQEMTTLVREGLGASGGVEVKNTAGMVLDSLGAMTGDFADSVRLVLSQSLAGYSKNSKGVLGRVRSALIEPLKNADPRVRTGVAEIVRKTIEGEQKRKAQSTDPAYQADRTSLIIYLNAVHAELIKPIKK